METAESIRSFVIKLTTADMVIGATGLLLFLIWLFRTHLGTRALTNTRPRRNNLAFYTPFIPLLIYFAFAPTAIAITRKILKDLAEWRLVFLDNLIICIVCLIAMAATIVLARENFARRMKGFGIDIKTIHKDIPAALLNLVTIFPLITIVIIGTGFFGRLIFGTDFQIQQHEELQLLTAYQQLPVRVIIVIAAILIAPVFEEMLFRGLFQSMLRSHLQRPWLAIVVSSALFATIHEYPAHWPALFALSLCMGYSYEKSGSLIRPILIHSLFNGIVVVSVLNQ
jgi:membrane protease YdiL (CAAX protease family)